MNRYHGIYLPYLSDDDTENISKVCSWLNENNFTYEACEFDYYIKFGVIFSDEDEEKVINAIMEIYNK